nr:1762_t:CDS:2 [Entrophospora candida]
MKGSVEDIEYAFSVGYGQEKNGYKIMKYKDKAELLTAPGDISWDSEDTNKPIVHCHAVFAKNDGIGTAFGGHLKEATVNLTTLIIIDILSNEKVVCKLDKEMNIKLWDLEKTDIAYIQLVDCEADDLITSFIKQSEKKYPNLIFDVFTRDKDLLQLLDKNTNILNLLGDSIDNIKGVKGIGPVSAKNLIQQFHTVENIYQQKNNLPESSIKLLENNQELVYRNKKIIGLVETISFPPNLYEKCDFN